MTSIEREPVQNRHAPSVRMAENALALDGLPKLLGQCSNVDELFETATRYLLEQSPNCFLVVHFDLETDGREGSQELTVLANRFESVPINIQQWAEKLAVQSIATGQTKLESTESMDRFTLIAVPIFDSAIAALFINAENSGSFEKQLLQKIGQFIRDWSPATAGTRDADSASVHLAPETTEGAPSAKPAKWQTLAEDTAALAEFHQALLLTPDKERFAKSFADQLSNCLAEARGSSEITEGNSGEITVYFAVADQAEEIRLTASSKPSLPDDSGLIECIESTMVESICRKQISSWPPLDNNRHALICHQKLSEKLDGQHIVSSPIFSSTGKLEGVALVASTSNLSDRHYRFFEVVADHAGDRLQLVRRTEKGLLEKGIVSIQEAYQSSRTWFILKLATILFAFTFIPQPYVVTSDCEIRPLSKRFVCAPFDARLERCLVEPGDLVSKGQIIGRLEDHEIRLELSQNQAELGRAQRTRDGYLASHESGKARLAELEYEKLLAQNELLRYKIENLQLTSPIDGVVIAGDLNDSIGKPLEKGDAMFEIAPLNEFLVEIYAPEDDVRFLKTGQEVAMRFDAVPFRKFDGKILRIYPESEVRANDNTFICLVSLNNSAPQMRPGMQGTFRISTVWRPFIWNYLRKPVAKSLRWLGW